MGAAIPSAVGAGLAVAGGLVTPAVGAACFGLGTLGGMLPDIDAERSVPTRVIFGALAAAAAVVVGLGLYGRSAGWLVVGLAAVVSFLMVRVGLRGFTAWLCVHRGLVHSLPFAALVGALAVQVGWRGFNLATTPAWLLGFFLTGGFVIHLVLDEMSSVDLLGARVKRSFGTAFKLGSRRQWIGTAGLYAGAIALLVMAPPADRVVRDLTSKRTRAAIAATFAGLAGKYR